jgi:hypothetical protein
MMTSAQRRGRLASMLLRSLALGALVSLALAGCPDSESPAGPWDTGPRIDAGGLPDAPDPIDAPTASDAAPTDAPASDAGVADAPADDAGTTDAP